MKHENFEESGFSHLIVSHGLKQRELNNRFFHIVKLKIKKMMNLVQLKIKIKKIS
jgi:hypothetical protein